MKTAEADGKPAHPTFEWVNSSEPTIRVGPIVGEFQPLLEPWTG
jgi:hypothetical protein